MITPPDDAKPIDLIANALTVALGARDHYTRVHCDRVVELSLELGRHIGLTSNDLGKIGIPDSVLHKPDSFDADEWACMQQHVLIGEQIVLAINGGRNSGIARTVRHHHEHFDGSGYPDKLSGGAIPLDARIISVADSYDAMTTRRPYQSPGRHRDIMDVLHKESGRKHDPDLVHAFSAIIEKSTMRAAD